MTSVIGGARRENSAEHSWHLAVMAPLLAEYAADDVDIRRVTTMVLIHDVVEIDAGDAFCFDEAANMGQRSVSGTPPAACSALLREEHALDG